MVDNTSAQGGCAFACHESDPAADNLGNPGGEDNYTLAQNLGVVTRMENLASATQSLMSSAASMEGSNQQYQMAIYTFNNSSLNAIQALTSNLANAKAAAANINVVEVYSNNWLTKTNQNNDTDTELRVRDVGDQHHHAVAGDGHAGQHAARGAVHRHRRRR